MADRGRERPAPATPGRFRLLLEFEGGGYRGWQKQGEKEIKTIQGMLLARAAELFATPELDIQGNGRTDAGVHALAYTAHLEVRTRLTAAEIRAGLNRLLPKDIAILDCQPADARFHARHNCVGRSYLYQIVHGQRAFMRRYSWAVDEPLDIDLMRRAAALFVGMHDFAAFAERQELKKSTLVLVNSLRVHEVEGMILVRVVASHFLWHLVRRLVGTLVAIGTGKLAMDEMQAMLASAQSDAIRWLAPAQGLFFEKAFYDREEFASFDQTAPLTPAPRPLRAGGA